MKVLSKVQLTTSALIMGIMASFAGAITSTLAWYAYSTTATVAYKGTSVAQSEQLQIGIMTTLPKVNPEDPDEEPVNVEFTQTQIEEYGMEIVNVGNKTYAFCQPGTGLNSDLISYYLRHAGYATNELVPTTSQKFVESDNDNLSLRQHLWSGTPINNHLAGKEEYSMLPLAFRVATVDEQSNIQYAKNVDVWLSSSKAIADGEGSVYKAVRTHFKSNLVNFIYNPSATQAGYTTMGGLLDLNKDGYYDSTSELEGNEEIIYGSYDGTLPSTTPFSLGENQEEIVDVNGTGNHAFETTFSSKHADGKNIYTDLSSINFHKGYYRSINEIKPSQNSSGFLSGGEVLCRTSNDSVAIAELDVTVWLEGWDHSVIDSEINHKFALGLTFEVNRVV